jgi:hypothetical protein
MTYVASGCKEGASVCLIGLPVLEYLEGRRDEEQGAEDYVFPGWKNDTLP